MSIYKLLPIITPLLPTLTSCGGAEPGDELPVVVNNVPELKQVVNLGDYNVGDSISGSLEISDDGSDLSNISGSCDINDSSEDKVTSFDLENVSNDGTYSSMSLPSNSGFGLIDGEYNLVCTFTDSEGKSTDPINTASFQVLFNNSAPTSPTGVALVDSDSLLKIDDVIRDINGINFCISYTDAGTDLEDSLYSHTPTVEGFYSIDGGDESGPIDLDGSKEYCFDILLNGESTVTAGFKTKDNASLQGASSDAYSSLASIAVSIHKNSKPSLESTLGSVSCDVGNSVTLYDQYTDAESDVVTTVYTVDSSDLNSNSYDCSFAGTYDYSSTAIDAYGASVISVSGTITVNAANTAPVYESGIKNYGCTQGEILDLNMNIPISYTDSENDVVGITYRVDGIEIQDGLYSCTDIGFRDKTLDIILSDGNSSVNPSETSKITVCGSGISYNENTDSCPF